MYACLLSGASLLLSGCVPSLPLPLTGAAVDTPEPAAAALYTAARQVRQIAAAPDGTLWAATAGGVVRWQGSGMPRQWTTADGLQSNDVRGVLPDPDGGGARIALPTAVQRVQGGSGVLTAPESLAAGAEVRSLDAGFTATSAGLFAEQSVGTDQAPLSDTQGCWRVARDTARDRTWAVTGRFLVCVEKKEIRRFEIPAEALTGIPVALAPYGKGAVLLASTVGLWHFRDGLWSEVPLPHGSAASHVSALCSDGSGGVFAGLYGDGIYPLPFRVPQRQPRWGKAISGLPAPSRQVTSLLAPPDGGLTVGTQRDGVWGKPSTKASWRQYPLPGALPSADIYAIAPYAGSLWSATFDQGLIRLSPDTGEVALITSGSSNGLSAATPRSLVPFGSDLFVRYANGALDRFDGIRWQPAFPPKTLPRPQIFALSTSLDTSRLLLGGWAGWAAFDGVNWEHHWKDSELTDQVITTIAQGPDGAVWVGTQKRGLLRWKEGRYTEYHENAGMTDDWVTCLAPQPDGSLLAGTYTGGLLRWEKNTDRFTPIFRAERFAIRAIATLPDGEYAVATPIGVYRGRPGHTWSLLDARHAGGLEAQALCTTSGGGLWVGTRTALAYVVPQK